jgi:hypothetical protein
MEAELFLTARKGKTKNIIIWENWGCALKWFCQKWFLNIAIQGPILWQKAEEIALQLSIGPLSSGWTDRVRKWASLGCWTTSGESKCGSEDEVETQRTVVLPTLLAKYEPEEMSGADECSTFYNLMSDKTCVFTGESCFGGKWSKYNHCTGQYKHRWVQEDATCEWESRETIVLYGWLVSCLASLLCAWTGKWLPSLNMYNIWRMYELNLCLPTVHYSYSQELTGAIK